MNMKKVRRVLTMAEAIDAKLPCDGYESVEVWRKRFAERLKDGGYTADEITERMADTLRRAEMREEARTRLRQLVEAHTNGTGDPAYDVVLMLLTSRKVFTTIRTGRDLSRLARHVKYFGEKSRRIREAYTGVFQTLNSSMNNPSVQAMFAHDIKASDALGKLYNMRLWRARDDAPYAFFPSGSFMKCTITNKTMPSSAALNVVYNERGLLKAVHPSLADDPNLIRRDPLLGELVLVDAVEWVTLDTGELVWRRHNEQAGTITYDDDQEAWVRLNARGAVAGYHSARRDWRRNEGSSRYRGCIGVELELGFKSSGQLTKFLNRFVDERGRFLGNRPFLVENDSSLSSIVGGVEIISEPLPLYEGYQSPDAHWRWLLEKLVQNGAEGWKHRARAGIHVNLDVSDKSSSHIARFVAFINNAASLSRFIAGRKSLYGHGGGSSELPDAEIADLKAFEDKDKNVANGGYLKIDDAMLRKVGANTLPRAMEHVRSQGKYSAVNIRNNGVLEVRIFGSNIRYEGFMACVEYCVAGMAFVAQLADDTAVMAADIGAQFRTWLSHNVAAYPNLASRIGVTESADTGVARPLIELVA